MKKMQFIIVVFLILYLAPQTMASDRLYVSDSFTITLRTGPSTENKIIRMLSSGQKLEILEAQEKWSHVKAVLNNGTEVEGWVRNQYLMERTPYETQANALFSENDKLKERLSRLDKQQKTMQRDQKDISTQFRGVTIGGTGGHETVL